MEKITSTTFYNSFTNEHIRTVALYKSDSSYAILTEYGDNYTGKERSSNSDAIDYYNEQLKDIRNYLNSEQISFYTK